jgi:hypothetical protein
MVKASTPKETLKGPVPEAQQLCGLPGPYWFTELGRQETSV